MSQFDFLSHVISQVAECNSNATVVLKSEKSKQVRVECPPGEDRTKLLYEFMSRWDYYKWVDKRSTKGTLELRTTPGHPYVIHFKDQTTTESGATDTIIQETYAKLCYVVANHFKCNVNVTYIEEVMDQMQRGDGVIMERLAEYNGFSGRMIRDMQRLSEDWKHSHCKSANIYFQNNPYGNLIIHMKSDVSNRFVNERNLHYLRVCNNDGISLNGDKNNPGDLIIVDCDQYNLIEKKYKDCNTFEEFNQLARQQFLTRAVRMVSLKKIKPTQPASYKEFDYHTSTAPSIEIIRTYYNRKGKFFHSNNAGIDLLIDGHQYDLAFRVFGGNMAGELKGKGKHARHGKVGEFLLKHELAQFTNCSLMTPPTGSLNISHLRDWAERYISPEENIDIITTYNKEYNHYFCRSKLKACGVVYLFRQLTDDQQKCVLTRWVQHAMSTSEYTNPHVIIN